VLVKVFPLRSECRVPRRSGRSALIRPAVGSAQAGGGARAHGQHRRAGCRPVEGGPEFGVVVRLAASMRRMVVQPWRCHGLGGSLDAIARGRWCEYPCAAWPHLRTPRARQHIEPGADETSKTLAAGGSRRPPGGLASKAPVRGLYAHLAARSPALRGEGRSYRLPCWQGSGGATAAPSASPPTGSTTRLASSARLTLVRFVEEALELSGQPAEPGVIRLAGHDALADHDSSSLLGSTDGGSAQLAELDLPLLLAASRGDGDH
jgi:hypothetical protein